MDPQSHTTSHDGKKLTKEERIALRAARVQAKKNKEDSRGGSALRDRANDRDDTRAHMSKAQITQSRNTVDQTKASAEVSVSDVQVDREMSENVRRRHERLLREERFERLEKELEESRKINEEIESRWEEVAQKNIPQELYAAISAQYKKASALLQQKDEMIQYLQHQLKTKDEEYVDLLAKQQEDIQVILRRMSENFARFLETCRSELHTIEETFLKERSELLEKNHVEMEALFEKRRKMELVIMESRSVRSKKFEQELMEIRSRDAEDYNALKIDLETSIALFEQQLEEMRATYQLNSEKLEYNHSVLIERDIENKATVEHHRQRMRRLKESLSTIRSRFLKQDQFFKNENVNLTEEYRRMTESFKDLQRKYAHFVLVDTRKYAEVWQMNEEQVMAIVHKVLQADRLIHHQILGTEWRPPLLPEDLARVTSEDGQVQIEAITSSMIFLAGERIHAAQIQANNQAKQAAGEVGATMNMIIDGKLVSTSASGSTPNNNNNNAAPSAGAGGSSGSSSGSSAPSGSKFSLGQIKSVLELLGQEVSFLFDSRLQETIQALHERPSTARSSDMDGGGASSSSADVKDEENMYKSDALLTALGVEDREDLDSLVGLFFDPNTASGSTPESEKATPTVHPNDVSKIIREFINKRQQVKTSGKEDTSANPNANANAGANAAGKDDSTATAGGGGGAAAASVAPAKSHDSVSHEKRARRKERERLFWYRLGHIVSSQTRSIWDALESWQNQYNHLLEQRAKLIEETTDLAKQNEELKLLLQQYLNSKVNQELEIPPTRLLRVNGQQ